jgi:hypothetical protein
MSAAARSQFIAGKQPDDAATTTRSLAGARIEPVV